MVVEGETVLQQMTELETTAYHELTGYPDAPVNPPLLIRIDVLPAQ